MMIELQDLKTKAEAAGTNLTELCRRAGVARSTPQRWFAEDSNGPNLKTLNKLRDALRDVVSERREAMEKAGL